MAAVVEALAGIGLSQRRVEQLKTVVAEATMNAMEHQQTPRGWGLFLIKRMVDELKITGDADHHTVELILRLDGQPKGGG